MLDDAPLYLSVEIMPALESGIFLKRRLRPNFLSSVSRPGLAVSELSKSATVKGRVAIPREATVWNGVLKDYVAGNSKQ